jgi:ABC-type nitrate/sulfonate/bicarbonate transport system substrate-binding protein
MRMRLRGRPVPIVLAVLALAVAGVPVTAQEEPGPSEVKIAADGYLLGTQAWVSLDQGYFDENSVEADVSLFGTGIEAIQGVIARQADLGHALDFAVLNLVAAADENMQIVGGIAQPNPGFHSLAVQNDITGPEDLVGKKIGYVEGTSEHFVTIQYLVQNGIALSDVELVPLPGLFELVGALKTGDIQASWLWLDGTTQAAEDPNLTVLTDDSDVLDTVAIYLIAEAGWAAENQLAIERVLKSYDQASAFINDDPVGAGQIVADAVSGDAELFANVIPNQNYTVGFTQVMLDSLDAIAGFLIESGKLDAGFDVRDFVDLTAQELAVPGSVTADLE